MSAHVIPPPPDTPYSIIIGWDGPTKTFFVHVTSGNEEQEKTIIDLGKRPGDLPTIADLEAALADSPLSSVINLTPELRQALEQEKAESLEPTDLQRRSIEMFLPSKRDKYPPSSQNRQSPQPAMPSGSLINSTTQFKG